MKRRVANLAPLTAALALALATHGSPPFGRTPQLLPQEIRIGIHNAPPFEFVDGDRYGGLAVELISEAARRLHIRLHWTPVKIAPDSALASGVVDMWPVLGTTRTRQELLHITRPWFENQYCIFSRRQSEIAGLKDAADHTVAYWNRPLATELAHRYFSDPSLLPVATSTGVVMAVCSGKAQAGFIEARVFNQMVLDEPRECAGVPLRSSLVRGATSYVGIAARKEFGPVADAIREEIAELVKDGTFESSIETWASSSADEMRSLVALQRTEMRNRDFKFGIGALTLLCVAIMAAAIIGWRSWRHADRARRLEAYRSRALKGLAAGEDLNSILASIERQCARIFPNLAIRIEAETSDLPAAEAPNRRTWQAGLNVFRIPVATANSAPVGTITVMSAGRPSVREMKELENLAGLAGIVIENRKLQNDLQLQATTDRLTGLANRQAFSPDFARAIEIAEQEKSTVSLFCVDVDRFKNINDGFGHQAGDAFLREVGRRMRTCFPRSARIARLGGDEFAAIVPGLDPATLERLATTLVQSLGSPVRIGGREIFGSASVGIGSYPANGRTSEEILQSADAALYRSKDLGRNQYQFASSALRDRASERVRIEQYLRAALEAGSAGDGQKAPLVLHYQPQFDVRGDLVGIEALARLQDSDGSWISPAQFIPVAEDAGLIARLDRWVMKTSCHQLAAWRARFQTNLRLAFNVSPTECGDADWVPHILEAVNGARLPSSAIQIELTESSIMQAGRQCRENLKRLRGLGVSIALDDFGTGYSSLSCLHQLPVDTVKIDRSFIIDLANSASSLPLIEAVVAAARALHLTVIAEGVETERQHAIVAGAGCDLVQGYFYSRPLPPEHVESLLAQTRRPASSMPVSPTIESLETEFAGTLA